MVLVKELYIKDEKIKMMKTKSKSQSIQNILVFIDLAKFCQQFIKSPHKIVILLISILRTTLLTILFTSNNVITVDIDSNKVVNNASSRGGNDNNDEKNKNLSKVKNIKNRLSLKSLIL